MSTDDDSVSLDSLFGDARDTVRRTQAAIDRASSMTNRARQRAGLLRADEVPARQQEEARRIAIARATTAEPPPEEPQPQFILDWYSTQYWRTPNGDYPIVSMESRHLYETLIWCVRSVPELHAHYDRISTNRDLLSAKYWLRTQPVFRAMLQEAIRRQFTFPPDVQQYINEYILRKQDVLATDYEPWNDPAAKHLQAANIEFLNEPIKPDDSYKERRSIDLS
jgi:hypothetical protein